MTYRLLAQVTAILEGAGLPYLLVYGDPVSRAHYHQRDLNHADSSEILVAPRDANAAVEALTAADSVRVGGGFHLRDPGGRDGLWLRASQGRPIRLSWRFYASQTDDLDDLFSRSLSCPLANGNICRILGREDHELLRLTDWHMGKAHGKGCKLLELLILDREGLDWEAILNQVNRLRVSDRLRRC